MTKTKKLLSSVFFFLLLGFAPSCELIEELTGEAIDSFFISSVGSGSTPTISGTLTIDGVEETIINIFNFSASESSVNFTIENEGFIGLSFLVPSKNGTFNIQQDVSIDEYAIRILADGSFSYFKSGSGTVSSFTKDILDSSRGKISFKLKGSGKFGGDDPRFGDRDIDFDLTVNFDNRNDPPYTPPVVVDNGDASGSDPGSCVNEIKATALVSYWDQIKPGSATGTGKKVAANTIFADYRASDVGLVIDATSGSTRYVVQIMFTASNLVANKTLEFRNAGTGTGLTNSGAVGRLIAFNGTVNDDWRTNRDFGENKNMGTLKILTVTPKITGTYSFDASGDGYPSLNDQFAKVSGTFCIDP